ncbi:NAD(P)/FAD-dependent oxidoreductase [Bacillus sp. FJAT-45037]|uniref:NAD(P)/FAD-dependent oxidoreductase n=1 Tax=Bacillus sp. FJAT-45037 TaxID=2011007 RepID=UPI000C240B12|nr:FAD-dependent oxidoreductase [Bacillus sp. FJAT-45037]
MKKETSVLILGAGLAGIMAANALKEKGIFYILIDKGRSVGGRMATRRIDTGKADHGAQFFTARSDEMKELVDQWIESGVVYEWTKGFHQLSDTGEIKIHSDEYPRYAATDGMNALTKDLATGIDVSLHTRAKTVHYKEGSWHVHVEDEQEKTGTEIVAKGLISTIPVPQALTWMDFNGIESDIKEELSQLDYEPCVGLMIALNKESKLPQKGGVQGQGDLAFIADNQQKGISTKPILTVHASGDWSAAHFDDTDEEIRNLLLAKLDHIVSEEDIINMEVKRWRYAKPKTLYPDRVLKTVYPAPIVFAGDCFFEGKVEGAILSGITAGKWIADQMKN